MLISASTAAGKTEAAFLPILTLVADRARPGLSVLYVSPLKALINDQFSRLDRFANIWNCRSCAGTGTLPIGQVADDEETPRESPSITPESIEAMFARRPGQRPEASFRARLHRHRRGARLHAGAAWPPSFVAAQTDRRGVAATPPAAIGLSATIGDLELAAAWLRPTDLPRLKVLNDPGEGLDLQLQIRGYVDKAPEKPSISKRRTQPEGDADIDRDPPSAIQEISDHLFGVLRGSNNLVFGGSRRTVETLADALRSKSERAGVPNEFYPHHGNLSKELREELESV